MSAEILLGPAVLAAVILLSVRAAPSFRATALAIMSGLGILFGLVTMFSAGSEETWRTATFSSALACVGAAIVCAWMIAGIQDAGRGKWQNAVLVGVAASAAALAAGNSWVVPALIFWVCSSFALGALALSGRGRVSVWMALFLSDALLIAALIGTGLDTEAWTIPDSVDGWRLVALLASAVIRSGALPKLGLWGGLGDADAAPILPLMTSGSFVAVTWALGDPVPWLGVALVLIAIATALWGLVRTTLSAPAAGAVPVALSLGVAVAEPDVAVAAGVAAVIAVSLVALWPGARTGAEAPRALHVSFVPPTIGFVAVVAASVATFDRAVESDRIADSVVNTLFSGLLPLALAVSVALGARIARAGYQEFGLEERESTSSLASAASWALLLASVALALLPPDVLALEGQPLGSTEARGVLAIALAVGVGVSFLLRGKKVEAPRDETEISHEISFRPLVLRTEGRLGRVLGYVTVLLALGSVAAVGWFTVYGMSLGFL